MTREGALVAEDLRFRIQQQAAEDAKPAAGRAYHVRCPACAQIFMQATDMFNPDMPVHGYMLDFLPQYKKLKWTLPFMPSSVGANIMCPGCDCVLTGMNLRFLDGVLVDPSEIDVVDDDQPETAGQVDAAESGNESTVPGKIDDNQLLGMVDSGKTQVEAAGFFGVTKQAISKRLKQLRPVDRS